MRTPHRKARRRHLEESSASKMLRGTHFNGKQVRRILKVGGARRQILYRSGPPDTVDRASIREMARWAGTVDYHGRLMRAKTLSAKKRIVRASRLRQARIKARAIKNYLAGAAVAPAHVKRVIMRQVSQLKHARWGSPILGQTPVTSMVPGYGGPAKTFEVIARTGVPWDVLKKKRGRRVRVLPRR